ncbi:glycophorin-C isoform X1 [Siphateles boraxobius]|uniref:glycophorin-C isoform X1 n=1 Tax=Siphateles boraxobius TaxID=180520 RepID=UPI0040636C07
MSVMANSTAQALNATSAESNFDTSPIPVQRPGPYFEAIVGAVIAVVVLVLLLLLGIILRYMYKHKGTYHTNEAKGTEFSETADSALRRDPALQDAMDESKKEYFI